MRLNALDLLPLAICLKFLPFLRSRISGRFAIVSRHFALNLMTKRPGENLRQFTPKELPNDINLDSLKEDGSVKIASYNVAGLGAALKRGLSRYIQAENADIVCLQEIKLNDARIFTKADGLSKDFYPYQYQSLCTVKKGYSGTAVFSKIKPLNVIYKVGDPNCDKEGRFIILEFEKVYLIAAYVLNAGAKLERLDQKVKHLEILTDYLGKLDESKPIIFGGDLNVAHTELDLARPKTNHQYMSLIRTAGFTPAERKGFSEMLDKLKLVDTWRHIHPETADEFTYYSYRFSCWQKNIGWRLDYFLVSERIFEKVSKSVIRQEMYGGSDHLPIVLVVKDLF